MTYRYMVLQNGVIYPAGEEVPEEKDVKAQEIAPSISEKEIEPKRKAGRPKKVEG